MQKKQKQILIVGWKTGDNSFGVTVPYLEYFSKFGQVHVLTPNTVEYVFRADLLVLPGGRDVNPTRYNQSPGYHTGHPEPILEYFDTKVLPKYIEKQIPIFGIKSMSH
jgi:gamma-glutamyl-gamma-aminobutyrate hydrolase PuuD